MDYKTRPASRELLRQLASVFRELFGVGKGGRFPVMEALEKFPEVFADSYFRIVDEDELPVTVAAQCNALSGGGFEILIKQSVYDGAYRGVGAYRDHIVHELCHAFLYSIGFTPAMDMSYSKDDYPRFCSSEWQAKALCGEVMMPYEETESLSKKKIEEYYGVSKTQAKFRKKY